MGMWYEKTDLGSCVFCRTVAGNELASSLVEDTSDEKVAKGAVVNFSFPADFLSQLRDLSYMYVGALLYAHYNLL